MKKIKISVRKSHILDFVVGIIISAAILLSSSSVYATASDNFECPDLSNEILKRQNLGTYFKPEGDKTEFSKDSLKYTQSLAKLDEKDKIKKLKFDFDASPAMQHLLNKDLHFDHVIKFATDGNETEFIYNKNILIAIASRNKATEKKANKPEDNVTTEDVLILNNCKISNISHITSLKDPKDNEAELEIQIVPSTLCKDLHKIKRLAVEINDDVDDFKYNCQQQGGAVILKDAAKFCKCYVTGNTFDPLINSCGLKKRHITTPSWKLFEKFITDHGGKWQKNSYTRKTYYEIKDKCSEYTQYLEIPGSVIKSDGKERSDDAAKVIQK